MKYLSNTIKMTLVVGILFFGLAVMSKADEVKTYKIQDRLTSSKVMHFEKESGVYRRQVGGGFGGGQGRS